MQINKLNNFKSSSIKLNKQQAPEKAIERAVEIYNSK